MLYDFMDVVPSTERHSYLILILSAFGLDLDLDLFTVLASVSRITSRSKE